MAALAANNVFPGRILAIVSIVSILVGTSSEAADDEWYLAEPEDTAVLQMDEGQVVIELNPVVAPKTVAQFKRLVREHFYDGESFYRVIDGFVAQGGDGSDMGTPNAEPTIEAEFEFKSSERLAFVTAQKPDLFAAETGFVDGFAVAREMESGAAWLVHCPGVVAMARLDDADSSSTDFYIVIGQAPRHLDRNMNIFGRVVYGMDVIQRLRRGPPPGGMIDDRSARSVIQSITIESDTPVNERLMVEVRNTNSREFQTELAARRDREAEFFVHKPPLVLDVCQIPNMGRVQ